MAGVLARRDRALTPEETEALLREHLGEQVLGSVVEFGTFTLNISPEGWVEAARLARDEPQLAYDLFDSLFGVDAREEGFDVVAVLYSTSTGTRLVLRTRVPGGRDAPQLASITDIYRGADWMERETWDMFGIVFDGHPGLEPRILTVDNFEGWPLRKDFHLASRAAKPWPGVKEPAELDEDGNVIERVPRIGDAPGPYELDKVIAEQAKLANPVPEPVTAEGGNVEELAQDADLASDSGQVLTSADEQAAEEAEAQASDVAADVAGAQAQDLEQTAKDKAEQRRREQAEARRRKAEERAADADDAGAAPDQEGNA